jgi:hypothetical protein
MHNSVSCEQRMAEKDDTDGPIVARRLAPENLRRGVSGAVVDVVLPPDRLSRAELSAHDLAQHLLAPRVGPLVVCRSPEIDELDLPISLEIAVDRLQRESNLAREEPRGSRQEDIASHQVAAGKGLEHKGEIRIVLERSLLADH